MNQLKSSNDLEMNRGFELFLKELVLSLKEN